MKKLIGLLLALLLCVSLAGCSSRELCLGTGPVGGAYDSDGRELSELLDATPELAVRPRNTAGSEANLRLMTDGVLQLAMVQSDLLTEAQTKPCGCGAVAVLYPEYCQIIVPADSPVKTVADLYGKTVSVGERESGSCRSAEAILKLYGLDGTEVTRRHLDYASAIAALENGEVDGIFITSSAPILPVSELAEAMDIRFLPLEEQTMTRLLGTNGGFFAGEIPANTYRGQGSAVPAASVQALLTASSDVPAETVQTVLEMLTDEIDLPAAESLPVRFHPGAAAWYARQGITVEALDPSSAPVPRFVGAGQDN